MKLDRNDLLWALKKMPNQLRKIMMDPEWVGKIFVGGGYLRSIVAGEPINDVDVFVGRKDDAERLASLLCLEKDRLYTTANAYTIQQKDYLTIQIIHRWLFTRMEDVSHSFDFTICCGVISYQGTGWDSFVDERFYIDIASKRLVYRAPIRNEDAGGSMLRVLKYYQKGYRIPLPSLGKVIARLLSGIRKDSSFNIENEQDMATLITALLVEVDPNLDLSKFQLHHEDEEKLMNPENTDPSTT